jgi:TRAP-type mannitol/chloroaromatic compound transport system permease small subunit
MVIWASYPFVMNSFRIGETSPDPGGLPARWILKAAIPVGFFLLLIQGLALIFRSWLVIRGADQLESR